jgi:molybdenum cofactor biosynthesis enzyme MoaA
MLSVRQLTPEKIRTLEGMRIVFSYRCNFNCRFCYQRYRKGKVMELGRLEEVVSSLPGDFTPDYITMMGGEIALYKEITEHFDFLHRRYPQVRKSITTNGSGSIEFYGSLHRHGIDNVTFSLQTLDPVSYKEITRQSVMSLDEYIGKILRLRQQGKVNVRINSFIFPKTVNEVYNFCKQNNLDLTFCEELNFGAKSIFDTMPLPKGVRKKFENKHQNIYVDEDGFEFWNYKHIDKYDYNNLIMLPDGTLTDDFGDVIMQEGKI